MRCAIVMNSVFVLLLAGCQRDPAAVNPEGGDPVENAAAEASQVIKIKVTAAGEISADGQPVTLEQLAAKLAGLKQAGGTVWYYRDNPEGESHPNAEKVIKLVIDNQLPVLLSTKPDFSDAMGD